MIGMMPNGAENRNARVPRIEIVEQPASKALRFRYECEGRSAGSIPGVRSTPENRSYPTIQIIGYTGDEDIVVIVSCITKDPPYRAHPHNLVGRECKDGICSIYIDKETKTAQFSNLGIQCVKKKDIEAALKLREEKKVDPYNQGFDHAAHPSSIDLNAVRLCFQAVIKGKHTRFLGTTVSEPIYDKKAMSDLVITKLSHTSAPVKGGSDVLLLCEKVAKEDIKIKFFEEDKGRTVWESFGEISLVHKQVAIAFKTPPYRILEINKTVDAYIQLFRPTDKTASDPLPFKFTPYEPDLPRRKTPKLLLDPAWRFDEERAQNQTLPYTDNSHASPFPIKTEPCPSPENIFSPVPGPSNATNFYASPAQSEYSENRYSLPPIGVLPRPPISVIPGVSDGSQQHRLFVDQRRYAGGSLVYAVELGNELMSLNQTENDQNQAAYAGYVTANQDPSSAFSQMHDINAYQVSNLEEQINTGDLLETDAQENLDELIAPEAQQNMEICLSENLSQSLNISSQSSKDSLIRIVNETYDEKFKHN